MHALMALALMLLSGAAQAEAWAIATQEQADGTQIVYRFAQDIKPGRVRTALPARATITWKYLGANGMPEAADSASMDKLDNLMHKVLVQTGTAKLVSVATGNGQKQWIFYTKSEDAFFLKLDKGVAKLPPFPIHMIVADDPGWTTYETFRGQFKDLNKR